MHNRILNLTELAMSRSPAVGRRGWPSWRSRWFGRGGPQSHSRFVVQMPENQETMLGCLCVDQSVCLVHFPNYVAKRVSHGRHGGV